MVQTQRSSSLERSFSRNVEVPGQGRRLNGTPDVIRGTYGSGESFDSRSSFSDRASVITFDSRSSFSDRASVITFDSRSSFSEQISEGSRKDRPHDLHNINYDSLKPDSDGPPATLRKARPKRELTNTANKGTAFFDERFFLGQLFQEETQMADETVKRIKESERMLTSS